ncbi:MAG: hypothetical protein F9K29_10950 [Hyphomicrobiaceae bacterium]|nr:MAG: hypothetical protein F9K29_10950 [Hyphomicrobiaceae bacterium]
MADMKDENGKGPSRPGEAPGAKRTYATIDLKATEVESKDKPAAPAKPETAPSSGPKTDAKPAVSPSGSQAKGAGAAQAPGADAAKASTKPSTTADALGARLGSAGLLPHLASGAVGAVLVLLVSYLLPLGGSSERTPTTDLKDVLLRLSDVEGVLGMRPGDTGGLRSRVDDLNRSIKSLGDAQSKLAGDTRALESRIGGARTAPQEIVARLTRLEETLAALPATSGAESDAARSLAARIDRDLAGVRTDAGRLAQRIDQLRGDLDERMKGTARVGDVAPLAARLAAVEQQLQSFLKSEADRSANTSRVVLSLELANLKRAMDRGEAYVSELAAVKKVATDKLNLAPLERYMREGVSTVPELAKSFRSVANRALDAEAEPDSGTLMDRLLSGARSIVRVRKAGHGTDDTSAEAVVGRMEAALKEGRLADVIEQGKKLPPKAALAAEEWLKKVEARQTVDQALADLETSLKISLGRARPTATDAKR